MLRGNNFMSLLILSELTWIFLYCLSVNMGTVVDDLLLTSLSFYMLGLAGVEFSFGFLLIILFKHFNEPLEFKSRLKNNQQETVTSSMFSRAKWL